MQRSDLKSFSSLSGLGLQSKSPIKWDIVYGTKVSTPKDGGSFAVSDDMAREQIGRVCSRMHSHRDGGNEEKWTRMLSS